MLRLDWQCAGGAIMTLLGEGCMDKSDRPGAREDNRQPTACQGGREGELGHLPYESLERQLSEDQDQGNSVKAADHDDELPLGSEANNLRQCGQEASSRSGGEPFQDKRLLWLRQNGGQIPNSGWTSFNSELSNLTSGSSANSVEWLLQERQADPEQVLLNLGFGGGLSQSAPMFTRIPERFLQAQNAPVRDEVPLEGNEVAVQQNSSRGASGWQTARSLSAAMFGIKMLSSLQQSSSMGILGSVASSTTGSPPCVTPPGKARSVLHPDNQRALALRGFYGDNLPEGLEVEFSNKREVREEKEDDSLVGKSAEDKRKRYHSTHSKHQRSIVEAGGEEAERAGEWTTSRIQ
ncbi:sperm-specific antigen 2-like [Pomacea canaliculata]|uniref:sperm-specific antigen 2-like n=1 Tax=Pomacea canaliculata TaxID=400727 RepID=UPI000D731B20|nr:sperm-specific antigen 2-like [Pomacea canaliculata]